MGKKKYKIVELTFTAPTLEHVEKIVKNLIGDKLVAMAYTSTHSTQYVWGETLHVDEAFKVVVRLLPDRLDRTIVAIQKSHPHTIPSIVWQEVETTEKYLTWLDFETLGSANKK